MAFLRNRNREKFTVIDNEAVRDDELSLKALGLLVKLLSLPDNWEFSEMGLTEVFKKDGRDSIRSGLKELESAGYLIRTRKKDSNGRVVGAEWIISENPMSKNPMLENPMLEKPTQYNTKEIKDLKNKTLNQSVTTVPLTDRFSEFWSLYPKKVGKQAALKVWKKIKPNDELATRIITALGKQRTWEQWTRDNGRYIPNPSTWLNQGRWEDEQFNSTLSTEETPKTNSPAAPSFNEVSLYAEEINVPAPQVLEFFDFWRDKKWLTIDGKMVDWKAEMQKWRKA